VTDKNKGYQVVPFPTARNVIIDAGRLAIRRHIIYALLELDITRARKIMREHKAQTGESLSFTAFLVTCLAKAIAAHPAVQAYRNWRNQLVIFDDVDVVTIIETEVDHVALPHIIRAANQKTFRQIHDEIRTIQASPKRSAQTGVLFDLGPRLPTFMRNLFYWGVHQNPHWFKDLEGTAMVTSVGMFGRGSGWGLAFLPYHTLGLTVGGIAEKPGVVDGRIEIREVMNLTIAFDHDIVDGAPAARFSQKLKELIESGEGIDLTPGPSPTGRGE
jgi:pyruvate/2-oxoglutarate dehydrogenase complex dihydrolipoamide acyltransferase (E2) component